jgi:hypothetical protein
MKERDLWKLFGLRETGNSIAAAWEAASPHERRTFAGMYRRDIDDLNGVPREFEILEQMDATQLAAFIESGELPDHLRSKS